MKPLARLMETKGRGSHPRNARSKTGTALGLSGARGFTLIEMLVVIVIIGILAAVSMPALKGFGKANVTTTATRQLLDDISSARQRALNTRAPVYMVFANPEVLKATNVQGQFDPKKLQYSAYALYSEREVGAQPGEFRPKYLTTWKTLPQGVVFAMEKLKPASLDRGTYNNNRKSSNDVERPFLQDDLQATGARETIAFPFPAVNNPLLELPYIKFDGRGQLVSEKFTANGQTALRNGVIPLIQGRIVYTSDKTGRVEEYPPGSSTNNRTQIHIDWLTGRGKVVREELQ